MRTWCIVASSYICEHTTKHSLDSSSLVPGICHRWVARWQELRAITLHRRVRTAIAGHLDCHCARSIETCCIGRCHLQCVNEGHCVTWDVDLAQVSTWLPADTTAIRKDFHLAYYRLEEQQENC